MNLQDYLNRHTGGDYSDPTTVFPQPVDKAPLAIVEPPVSTGGPVATAPMPPSTAQTPAPAAPARPPASFPDNPLGRFAEHLFPKAPQATPSSKPEQTGLTYSGNDPRAWIEAQFGTLAPTTQSLEQLYNALKAAGVNVQRPTHANGTLLSDDKLVIDGRMIDLIQSVGTEGARWTWQDHTDENGGGGGGQGVSGREFNDPWGGEMESLTRAYIDKLLTEPSRAALTDYIKGLTEGQATAKARAGEFADSLRERVTGLRGPAYNDAQIQALRTGAVDSLERRRQQTLTNEREKVYLRGFEPTSGLVRGAENEVNRNFEQARTGVESDLLRSEIEQTLGNQRYADQLEGVIQQALEGGDVTALRYLAQVADIENKQEQDRLARQREAVSATGGPLALIASRLAGANSTLSLSSPASSVSSLIQLINAVTGRNQVTGANSNANMEGLALLLDTLLN